MVRDSLFIFECHYLPLCHTYFSFVFNWLFVLSHCLFLGPLLAGLLARALYKNSDIAAIPWWVRQSSINRPQTIITMSMINLPIVTSLLIPQWDSMKRLTCCHIRGSQSMIRIIRSVLPLGGRGSYCRLKQLRTSHVGLSKASQTGKLRIEQHLHLGNLSHCHPITFYVLQTVMQIVCKNTLLLKYHSAIQ